MTALLISMELIRQHLQKLIFKPEGVVYIVEELRKLCLLYPDSDKAGEVLAKNFIHEVNKIFSSDQFVFFVKRMRPICHWNLEDIKSKLYNELDLFDFELDWEYVTAQEKAEYLRRKKELIEAETKMIREDLCLLKSGWIYGILTCKNWREIQPPDLKEMPRLRFIGPQGWNPKFKRNRRRR